MRGVTLVTGIWDIGRGDLSKEWSRGYDYYLSKFKELIKIDNNLIIFGDEKLRQFVFDRRNGDNTLFIERNIHWFKNNEYFESIQKIRNNIDWVNQTGWLKDSTQARLEYYNPLVMSKMFLLNDAKILDKFNSDYLFWIDGGITNTVHYGYFTHDKVLNKIEKNIDKFSFICFPYDAEKEIHGFNYEEMNRLVDKKINKVARGGFFGGPKESISEINGIYYELLKKTLDNGLMGTEESIFTILTYKYPDLINYFEIESNGLLGTFFENLKNEKLICKREKNSILDASNVALYVITFNSPKQFSSLIQSFIDYDINFLNKPKKFLLDNSTDQNTYEEYSKLCKKYEFEHIKKENLGICGGRQFIAEHSNEHNFDYYFFFEDDMFLNSKKEGFCKNGFRFYEENLFDKSLKIINENNYDFIKLCFTEFYGDNKTQWSWYNVPQHVREKYWPNKNKLPDIGLDKNPPKTKFKNIGNIDTLSYIDGEIYYCNWPQLVSKYGNEKMFLNTKWAHPYEQTWMSHIYQETVHGNIHPAILLLSPIKHDRFEHYSGNLRKES